MCACVRACVRACMRTCMRVCRYAFVYECVLCTRACMRGCVCLYMQASLWVFASVSLTILVVSVCMLCKQLVNISLVLLSKRPVYVIV